MKVTSYQPGIKSVPDRFSVDFPFTPRGSYAPHVVETNSFAFHSMCLPIFTRLQKSLLS
ncbi:hypothetical protein WH47_02227 [Habropoda laboriosa]|uniref:Uncharacterized protein n=1 Tax=Habropoda laboriosa TaxID=597456 RepID=A0A0L7QZC4_9HYME|nr:hypothetical protein WH47_02227 [Habropoda laboriosa]